jgi:hypothetical protein
MQEIAGDVGKRCRGSLWGFDECGGWVGCFHHGLLKRTLVYERYIRGSAAVENTAIMADDRRREIAVACLGHGAAAAARRAAATEVGITFRQRQQGHHDVSILMAGVGGER